METRHVKVGGGRAVFWRVGERSRYDVVNLELERIGLGELKIERRRPMALLRDAIASDWNGPAISIEPLKAKGWHVVRMNKGTERNTHEAMFSAFVDDRERIGVTVCSDELSTGGLVERLEEGFTRAGEFATSAQVVDVMVGALDICQATCLRPSGGLYWLADRDVERWGWLCAAIERASCDGKTTIYGLNHALDADALRAVHDAIVAEVEADAATLQRESESGDFQERGIETRRAAADALRDKVATYEGILGVELPALRQSADAAKVAAAKAALQLSCAGGGADERDGVASYALPFGR